MTPHFHPELVNGEVGDPVVYVDCQFEGRGVLFDLGLIDSLPPRKVLRLSHVFVSHTHMDHFMGFDRILRLGLGRTITIEMFGPAGIVDGIGHKLAAYTWNLVDSYPTDFTVVAVELNGEHLARRARFRCRNRFRAETLRPVHLEGGVLVDEENFRVRGVELQHGIPSLAFALEEKQHANVWKNRLDALGLSTGPWLRELKRAVLRDASDDTPIRAWRRDGNGEHETTLPLGRLRDVVRLVPGQKIAYVVDTLLTSETEARIVELARDADVLFIEAPFLEADAERAARTRHLTARQAGRLARLAAVRRFVPMHFSPRYAGRQDELRREAMDAFAAAR